MDSAARDTAKQTVEVKAKVAKLQREIEAVQRGTAATKVTSPLAFSASHFSACQPGKVTLSLNIQAVRPCKIVLRQLRFLLAL